MSLYQAMREYANRSRIRLHTPGHKGKLKWTDFAALDITELGVGGSVFPSDLITKAETKAADFYGSHAARFLVNGASGGLKAAIVAVDADCIVDANCHRAVTDGLRLARRQAVIVPNIMTDKLPLPLTVEQIERAAKANPNAKAVVITTPNYYGMAVKDPVSIVKAAHKLGLAVISDSAHGAHYPAHKIFPKSMTAAADYTVLSGHKTLDTLTQGAYLCINDTKNIKKVDGALDMLGTTSPSYLILASLEYGIEMAHEAYKLVPRVIERIEHYKKELSKIYNMRYDAISHPTITQDPFRLVVDATKIGMSGYELEALERARGVECELATETHVVYIFSFADGR